MNREEAKLTLLARAVELTDADGRFLPYQDRDACTRDADPPQFPIDPTDHNDGDFTTAQQAFIARRAALVVQELRERRLNLPALLKPVALSAWVTPALCIAVFVVGFLAHEVTTDRRLNLLAFPLLWLILWNLAIYVFLLVTWPLTNRNKHKQRPTAARIGRLLQHVNMRRLAHHAPQEPKVQAHDHTKVQKALFALKRTVFVSKAGSRFLYDWSPLQLKIALEHAKVLVHACALSLTLGATFGLILSGMHVDYRAWWETTYGFLTAERVHEMLFVLMWPASQISGIQIPDSAAIEMLRQHPANAEDWIWLFSIAALVYVGVPRSALILLGLRRAFLQRQKFWSPRYDDPYFYQLFQPPPGPDEVVFVFLYRIELNAPLETQLREALAAKVGKHSKPGFITINRGERSQVIEERKKSRARGRIVIVCSLLTAPDDDVHGGLLCDLAVFGPFGPQAKPLLLLAHAKSGLRGRYGDWKNKRAWKRFASKHKAQFYVLSPLPVAAPSPRRKS